MNEYSDIIIAKTVNEAKEVRDRLATVGIEISAKMCFGRRSVRALEGLKVRVIYTTEHVDYTTDQSGYQTHPMKWARWRVRKNLAIGQPGALVYLERTHAAEEAV